MSAGRSAPQVAPATVADAPVVRALVQAAFAARPALDPPAPALTETDASVARVIASDGGLLAHVDGLPVGALLLGSTADGSVVLRRVSVLPQAQGHGVASALVAAGEAEAARRGARRLLLTARPELPRNVSFWQNRGFEVIGEHGASLLLAKPLPALLHTAVLPTAEATSAWGRALADVLVAGDLLVLTGSLGAGKTTLVRGLGEGLGVRGPVTSPTFVIARVHPSLVGGPALVHVDAYRLGGLDELEDLDLEASLEDSVTVVEWGAGLAERLAPAHLLVDLRRSQGTGDPGDPDASDTDPRLLTVRGRGERWRGVRLPPAPAEHLPVR